MSIQNRIVNAFRRNPGSAARRRSMLRIAGLVGALLIAVLLISACNKVPLPESDDSAPRVDWRIIDALGGGLARGGNSLSDATTTAYAGEMAVVQLQAQDSEGVKRVKLSDPVMTFTCVSASGDTFTDGDTNLVLDYQEEILGPDADGEVFSELWLVDTVYFNYDCGDGFTLGEARAIFYAEVENYFGSVSTGNLELIYAP